MNIKLTSSLSATVAATLFVFGNATAGDLARNLAPLFGDFHASPGMEVAIPFLKFNDADLDGYHESVSFNFKVFKAGTNTLLLQTPVRKLPTPAKPAGCTASQADENLDGELFFSRRSALLNSGLQKVDAGKRLAIAFNMNVWCPANGNETLVGNVYSADLSGTAASGKPGPTWVKTWKGRFIEGLNGLDVDGDLVNDFTVITTNGETPSGWTLAVFYANGTTGATNTTITTSGGATYTLPASGRSYVIEP